MRAAHALWHRRRRRGAAGVVGMPRRSPRAGCVVRTPLHHLLATVRAASALAASPCASSPGRARTAARQPARDVSAKFYPSRGCAARVRAEGSFKHAAGYTSSLPCPTLPLPTKLHNTAAGPRRRQPAPLCAEEARGAAFGSCPVPCAGRSGLQSLAAAWPAVAMWPPRQGLAALGCCVAALLCVSSPGLAATVAAPALTTPLTANATTEAIGATPLRLPAQEEDEDPQRALQRVCSYQNVSSGVDGEHACRQGVVDWFRQVYEEANATMASDNYTAGSVPSLPRLVPVNDSLVAERSRPTDFAAESGIVALIKDHNTNSSAASEATLLQQAQACGAPFYARFGGQLVVLVFVNGKCSLLLLPRRQPAVYAKCLTPRLLHDDLGRRVPGLHVELAAPRISLGAGGLRRGGGGGHQGVRSLPSYPHLKRALHNCVRYDERDAGRRCVITLFDTGWTRVVCVCTATASSTLPRQRLAACGKDGPYDPPLSRCGVLQLSLQEQVFRSREFGRLMKRRPAVLGMLLQPGAYVLHCDLDTVFRSNPLPFHNFTADISAPFDWSAAWRTGQGGDDSRHLLPVPCALHTAQANSGFPEALGREAIEGTQQHDFTSSFRPRLPWLS
eukprot:scaffold5321_cov366-Prasinococcus_capsulatus_cf.AAC.3